MPAHRFSVLLIAACPLLVSGYATESQARETAGGGGAVNEPEVVILGAVAESGLWSEILVRDDTAVQMAAAPGQAPTQAPASSSRWVAADGDHTSEAFTPWSDAYETASVEYETGPGAVTHGTEARGPGPVTPRIVTWSKPTPAPASAASTPTPFEVRNVSGPVRPRAAAAAPVTAAAPRAPRRPASPAGTARLAQPGANRLADVPVESEVVFWN